jgi:hypothetical protein
MTTPIHDPAVTFSALSEADQAAIVAAAQALHPGHSGWLIHGSELRCRNADGQLLAIPIHVVRQRMAETEAEPPRDEPATPSEPKDDAKAKPVTPAPVPTPTKPATA